MPKATLHFDLPEEAAEFMHANSGQDYHFAIESFRAWIRDWGKYGSGEPKTAEDVQQAFFEHFEGLVDA